MVIGRMADGVARSLETVGGAVSEAFFEPVIRLGVTGLSRAGKTVFITSLVANLMDRGRMTQLRGAASGSIRAAWLQPQPDVTVPRFDYETHLAALTGPEPHWPQSTSSVSELRLSFRVQPSGLLGAVSGARTVHLDIVDYPGEWLLDLALLDKSFAQWSAEVLERRAQRDEAAGFRSALEGVDASARHDEATARTLAQSFTGFLIASRDAGLADCTPGRFLLPGDLAGSPVLTFAPLPAPRARPGRESLWREMERRYDGYRAKVVRPFFRDRFARIDRQVVLVDTLGAIHAGPRAVEDLRQSMIAILGAFRPGRNAWLTRLMRGKRVERILFAATKADHLHHSQHARLTAIMETMLRDARDRADFAGAQTKTLAIAAMRATVEETLTHDGTELDCVRGAVAPDRRQMALYPGELPGDPGQLLGPARDGAARWLDRDFEVMRFLPARFERKPGDGLPHIRLDSAAEFLLGDRLT